MYSVLAMIELIIDR